MSFHSAASQLKVTFILILLRLEVMLLCVYLISLNKSSYFFSVPSLSTMSCTFVTTVKIDANFVF